MDLKIDFGTEDSSSQTLNLNVTIKYNEQIEIIPLGQSVSKEEFNENAVRLSNYLHEVRTGLNDAVSHLKKNKMEITVKSIKNTFLESNKAIV